MASTLCRDPFSDTHFCNMARRGSISFAAIAETDTFSTNLSSYHEYQHGRDRIDDAELLRPYQQRIDKLSGVTPKAAESLMSDLGVEDRIGNLCVQMCLKNKCMEKLEQHIAPKQRTIAYQALAERLEQAPAQLFCAEFRGDSKLRDKSPEPALVQCISRRGQSRGSSFLLESFGSNASESEEGESDIWHATLAAARRGEYDARRSPAMDSGADGAAQITRARTRRNSVGNDPATQSLAGGENFRDNRRLLMRQQSGVSNAERKASLRGQASVTNASFDHIEGRQGALRRQNSVFGMGSGMKNEADRSNPAKYVPTRR